MRGSPVKGFTLPEVIITFLLSLLVIQGAWAVFAGFRRGAAKVVRTSGGLESIRTIGWVLSEELGGGALGLDWTEGGGDSVSLKAYRGLAWVETRGGAGEVEVCFQGIRSPEPGKDSILALGPDGSWMALDLLDRTVVKDGCLWAPEGRLEAWKVEEGREEWELARLFETGSYHFYQGALRRRWSGGGRQPLTPGNLRWGTFLPGTGTGRGGGWRVELDKGGSGVDTLPWAGAPR